MLKIIFGFLCFFLNNNQVFGNHMYPIVPDCVVNYTSFLGKYADTTYIDLVENYTDISGYRCGHYCNMHENCTSFNFFPSSFLYWNSESKCQLIKSTFNSSLLEKDNNVGFYLKSINDCSEYRTIQIYRYLIIGIFGLIGLVFFSWCLCLCGRRKKRNEYYRLN
ncbi:hypothetical protein CPAV1605_1183 [seawater metagenome]|uniref:Apple domain-containing protein n=1 Tax=seawater metagenome TaxID=1561972 RepID=A0A5E8CM67_9ZZZZ